MKKFSLLICFLLLFDNIDYLRAQPKIIDHLCTNIQQIPESAIINAKINLHIAYGHTSHGSQIITGMNALDQFMGGSGLYNWNDGPMDDHLDIDDRFASGDLGNPNRIEWASRTRNYLNNPLNNDVNVVIWSWCGQVSSASENDISTYLNLMNQLELEYPNVCFVYMTGHLDGSGLSGNLHLRNEQIRDFCKNNEKILYDFADIECYDPDGNYYGDKFPNDNCDYDTDGNGSRDGNWALEWQNTHTLNVDWYNCSSAHSQALNANLKAYAAWWLWAELAGWSGVTSNQYNVILPNGNILNNNYPNPFNPKTMISYELVFSGLVNLSVYNSIGEHVETLFDGYKDKGFYEMIFYANNLPSGNYYYRLKVNNFTKTKRMMLLK
jgi:hypothetical protein